MMAASRIIHTCKLVAALLLVAGSVEAQSAAAPQLAFARATGYQVFTPACQPGGPLAPIYICGAATSTTRCPLVSCSTAFAAAFSRPGCPATAISQIAAISHSSTTFAPLQQQIQAIFNSSCTLPPSTSLIVSKVTSIANAIATVTAGTLIQYSQYTCACGTSSSAYSQVTANVVAVANAVATALSQAAVTITGSPSCSGEEEIWAYAVASSTAIAQSIEVAVDNFYRAQVSGPSCSSTGLQNQLSSVVATAVVCTLAHAYGLAYTDPDLPGAVGSCSKSAAFTGLGGGATTARCDVTPVCPCDGNELVVNGGFEDGLTGWDLNGFITFVSSSLPHTGSYSLQAGQVGSSAILTQNVGTVTGVWYQLSFFLRNNGEPLNFFDVQLSADASTIVQHGPYPDVASDPPAPRTPIVNAQPFGWNQYVYTFQALEPVTTITLTFQIRQDPSYFFLDDISLKCTLIN